MELEQRREKTRVKMRRSESDAITAFRSLLTSVKWGGHLVIAANTESNLANINYKKNAPDAQPQRNDADVRVTQPEPKFTGSLLATRKKTTLVLMTKLVTTQTTKPTIRFSARVFTRN
ncbi:hypothetical protein L484_016397 [Morus notabilis]|uniref:Uncharacterized protein n=1 Tax=Morus notabilis TaxID=981085 RepID=W9RYT5_9ROSA|nr:hypothetical protein L484_016397 [Morus notabilis]